MRGTNEVGRTRLYTRRERRHRHIAAALAVLGALLAAWVGAAVAAWATGHGWAWPQLDLRPPVTQGQGGGLLGLPTTGEAAAPRRPQLPVTLSWPASPLATAMAALPIWALWLRVTVRPMLTALRQDTRHRGLAPLRAIRAALGARRVRRAGRFTLPGTPWYRWWLLPTTAFGYFLGHPLQPAGPRMALWADWEQRIRIIARPGWGKTTRLLVPLIRTLPGPVLVSSTEPAIFKQTVLARQHHQTQLRWTWLTRCLQPWLPTEHRPVAVVDFSHPDHRYAAGYPQVRWNPITGCEDFTIAHRRAAALLQGAHQPSRGDNDQFFRDSATEVLAAWLHAAALDDKEIQDVTGWLRKPTDPVPSRILSDDHRAEPSALLNLAKHLDSRAGKTSSGVERYLALAMNSLATTDGRRLCGHRFDPRTGQPVEQFDMPGFITAGGTVYVLADPSRVDRARPLLSLFVAEMFLAAEHVALRHPWQRLPVPFIGVLDELRHGITVPNLPYIAAAQRKYGIGFIYSVQSSTQEDALYGPDAQALRDSTTITLVGGIDITLAHELSDRAGTTPVVTATRGRDIRDTTGGRHTHSEHLQPLPTLTIADQQQLADGHAVLIPRGLAPFLIHVPSIYDHAATRRQIHQEATQVDATVIAARQAQAAIASSRNTALAAGAHLDLADR